MGVTWIGRASRGAGEQSFAVRVTTDGRAPAPADIAELIDDPVAVAERTSGELGAVSTALETKGTATVSELVLAPPVRPRKILCVGRNYRAHAEEFGNEVPTEPLLFFKPSSSLSASGGNVEIPRGFERVDMESELVAVVGKTGRNISRASALHHIAGYTLGNDVSNRDLQRGDKQWTRGKGFDTFAPLGPWLRLTAPGFAVPGDARIQGRLDGELRQDSAVSLMVFDVATVVEHISACMTLEVGDVLYTGTPKGVSALRPGQQIEIRLEGFELGTLVSQTV